MEEFEKEVLVPSVGKVGGDSGQAPVETTETAEPAQLDDAIYEKKLYKCQRCGEYKVRKRLDSKYIPKYCDDCIKVIRKQALRKANRARHDKKWEEIGVNYVLPDGNRIKLKDEQEKEYLKNLQLKYMKDFEYENSADLTLLSTLLLLSVEAYRVETVMFKRATEAGIRNLTNLTKEIRNIQSSLGITREQRSNQGEGTVLEKFQKLHSAFLDYYEQNKDKFLVKCPECGKVFTVPIDKNV